MTEMATTKTTTATATATTTTAVTTTVTTDEEDENEDLRAKPHADIYSALARSEEFINRTIKSAADDAIGDAEADDAEANDAANDVVYVTATDDGVADAQNAFKTRHEISLVP